MPTLLRCDENPILVPNPNNEWEHDGAFNGCVVAVDGVYHMVYRALSSEIQQDDITMQTSTVGYAKSTDGIHFTDQKLLFGPTEDWEKYGVEDPRITYMDGKFYIFYTALSVYPFAAYGIKLAVAITTDFEHFEKHPVTNFNAKAMALFPEKINGKYVALLTINTDLPPAKIGVAVFDNESDIWSSVYWTNWYNNANEFTLNLLRDAQDQVELGAPPLKTEHGWLVIYSYIKNYLSNDKIFGIEAVLLDLTDPRIIIGRSHLPLLTPEEPYELEGVVPNVVFPSGALIKDEMLYIYYGAADTRVAMASMHVASLLDHLKPIEKSETELVKEQRTFQRFIGDPILEPRNGFDWEKNGVFNPAAVYEDGKFHILYRAQGADNTSTVGYAASTDGYHIDERLDNAIYVPRESFEQKTHEGNSGCEDPRFTKIDNRFYLIYTAYDGTNPPRVALTSISVEDFLKKNWNWDKPKLISPPGVDDKDACIVKNTHGEGYIAFHRLGDAMWIDFLRDLDFPEKKYLTGGIFAQARKDMWDNVKLGIAAPPIETKEGWLLLYHAVSEPGFKYKVGAMLLDYSDPRKVLGRTDEPIFEPIEQYELQGIVPNVVFPCGAVLRDGLIYIYYGGADYVTGVATMEVSVLLTMLLNK